MESLAIIFMTKILLGKLKNGTTITEVDLSQLDIQFPKEGFFVAIEWLIIEPNKHE